ncbi:hypothetical protein NLX86_06480 [Streptomyces sp. A3M-1-3]|uniref:hypothetical protein n=1 Tax=Streptomyces sp. A3M-1-3 TaxID=2962044 RepID=UPI0020B781C4|nr:hypothetical protein [Streptomyces sp. A3M-1-3]MCP3817792.1 hypothetical protein [Streptomyces sp. A3M-1-3]
MNTKRVNAAAGVILAAMKRGKTLPTSFAYDLEAACLINSPEIAVELARLRAERQTLLELLPAPLPKVVLAEGVPARAAYAVWEQVAAVLGVDMPQAAARAEGDVTPQVQKLRGILARQRAAEDPHDSPLHHEYRIARDLEARP